MSPDPNRGLILDCDGVLADTELNGHLVAFNQAFAELGHDIHWTKEEYKVLLRVGGGKERLMTYLTQHREIDIAKGRDLTKAVDALHRRKSEIYVHLVEAGQLPGRPGIRRLVTEALDAGWKVGVASTSAVKSVEAVLRAVVGEETSGRLSGVFAGDIVFEKKPAPDIYDFALRELGRGPEEVVVVEDSESGALAAARAGLSHIVTVSYFTAEDDFAGATVVVDNLGEPDSPAAVRSGAQILNAAGYIDVSSLEHILEGAD